MIRTSITRLAIALLAIAGAASLAGCASGPRPFSIEEKIWFDKATGSELLPPHRGPLYAPYPPPEFAPYPAPGYR